MGVLYIVTPPTDEVSDWLADTCVSLPDVVSSRSPLLSEIRHVLDSLEGYSVDYTDNGRGSCWHAMITSTENPEDGRWTRMNITSLNGPSEPQEIWFEKGHPELIVQILCRLSSECGTLVVIPDTGCPPLVITAGDDPEQLCAKWEHLTPNSG